MVKRLLIGWSNYGSSIFFGNPRLPDVKDWKSHPMYVKLFENLSKAEVKFLILGGAAVSLHGFSRMTTDIDILLQNTPENVARFLAAANQWGAGFSSSLTCDDFQGPGCVRIEEDFPLDVFTLLNGKPYEYFISDAANYEVADGLRVQCLSVAALIELKKGTLREKDQLDVTVLKRLQVNPESGQAPTINLAPPPAEPE